VYYAREVSLMLQPLYYREIYHGIHKTGGHVDAVACLDTVILKVKAPVSTRNRRIVAQPED
jgi:hypothetical protein